MHVRYTQAMKDLYNEFPAWAANNLAANAFGAPPGKKIPSFAQDDPAY